MTSENDDKKIHSLYKVNKHMKSFGLGNDFVSLYKPVSSIDIVISMHRDPNNEL